MTGMSRSGARMYAAGLWLRPMIYGQPGESVEQAYVREARAVRVERRHRRRLDARQDRRAGAGCGGIPRPRLHQHVFDARRRQGALRPDAARGRHRPRRRHHLAARRQRLPDDHDHGQCRQGHAASRIFPRRRLAGPQGASDVRDRRMGGRRDRRTEGAGKSSPPASPAPRSTTTRCRSWASSMARSPARR